MHVGDLAACASELARLQGLGDALLAASPPAPSSAWFPIAHRFRWLRETLVAARAGSSPLAAAVYGSAADAALRARDWGEFLKSASHLAELHQVELEAGVEVEVVEAPPHPPRLSAWGSDDDDDDADSSAGAAATPSPPPPSPWTPGEALSSLILYFAAAAPTPQCLDAARLLRKAAVARMGGGGHRGGAASPSHLAFALAVHAAIRRGDGLALCALAPPSWRAAVLTEAALCRARLVGLATLGGAYRSLPAEVAVDRLGLGGGEDVDAAHVALASLVREAAGLEVAEGGKKDEKKKGDAAPPPPPAPAWAVRAVEGAKVGGELLFKA